MKKFLFIISAVAVCFCISCSDKGGMSKTAKKNLETHHAIVKALESGDLSKLGDYIATDAVDHAGQKGDVVGLENIKADLGSYSGMVGDMSSEVVKEMADDDYAMVWAKEKGTMKVDGMGMKAGTKYESSSVHISKFKDGKAVEHWYFMSTGDVMKMMPPQPMTDTTRHM